MSESGCLVQGEAAVRLRAQRSEPRVRCGRRARSARPRGFSLGLRCHHAVPHADYGVAPLPLYLHCTSSVAYIPSALCTPASNLPIAIKKNDLSPLMPCERTGVFGTWVFVGLFFLFIFFPLRCVTFAHIRLRKKETHCAELPQQACSSQFLPVRCVAPHAR